MDWLPNFNQSNIVIALRAALAAAAILYNARTAPLRAMIRAAENRPSGVKAGGLQARDQADDAAKIVFREKAAPAIRRLADLVADSLENERPTRATLFVPRRSRPRKTLLNSANSWWAEAVRRRTWVLGCGATRR